MIVKSVADPIFSPGFAAGGQRRRQGDGACEDDFQTAAEWRSRSSSLERHDKCDVDSRARDRYLERASSTGPTPQLHILGAFSRGTAEVR